MQDPRPPHSADVLHAFKWSILGEAATRLIAPAVFLVLARLLTPEDFGVVAAATVDISLCQAIADAGLGKALIRQREDVETSAIAVFWISLATSLALGLALAIASPMIAGFFGDARVEPVVRVLALQVPLTGLAAVPVALLQRDLAFRELFWVRLVTAGLPAMASIPMALAGYGYWALVAGAVIGQGLQCVVLWYRSHWRPGLSMDMHAARQLVGFGRWTMLSAMLAWCYGWLDSLVVARFLGTHDMGLYRVGNAFVTMTFGLMFAPLLPVLYSLFSADGHARERVATTLMTTARAIALVSLPAAAMLVLLGPAIESVLFGSKWVGLYPVFSLLAAGQGIAWLVGANGEAYRAVGRPDLEAWAMGIALLVYFAGYLVAVAYGLVAFAAARAAMVLVGVAVHVHMSDRLFGLHWRDWLVAGIRPACFALLAGATAWAISMAASTEIASASILVVTFPLAYSLLVVTFDRPHLRVLHGLLRGRSNNDKRFDRTDAPDQ